MYLFDFFFFFFFFSLSAGEFQSDYFLFILSLLLFHEPSRIRSNCLTSHRDYRIKIKRIRYHDPYVQNRRHIYTAERHVIKGKIQASIHLYRSIHIYPYRTSSFVDIDFRIDRGNKTYKGDVASMTHQDILLEMKLRKKTRINPSRCSQSSSSSTRGQSCHREPDRYRSISQERHPVHARCTQYMREHWRGDPRTS